MNDGEEIDRFWAAARHQLRLNPVPGYLGTVASEVLPPPAWSFGATADVADTLLQLVLAGAKTATAGALWDYEAASEQVPRVGDLSILLDGAGHPRALIKTTAVDVVPFEEVTAEHAWLEGEGDRTLETWRTDHQQYFTEHRDHDRDFTPQMPVVLERFDLVYPL